MLKDLITLYADEQIYILWTLISVLLVIIFFLTRRNKKLIVVPIGFSYKLLEKNEMLVYGLSVGPAVDHDVVKRVLTIEINDVLVETREFEPSATDLGEVGCGEGDSVNLALVDVDDAGNASEPAFVKFVGVDTIPPSAPGAFGAMLLREVVSTVDFNESDVTPVVEVVLPDPVDMETVVVVTPPESLPSGDSEEVGPLTPPAPESPPSGDPVL